MKLRPPVLQGVNGAVTDVPKSIFTRRSACDNSGRIYRSDNAVKCVSGRL